VDDEGTPTQKTVLIEIGILNNYLSDRIGAVQVGISRTGSARRESYKFAPVSRMRNTFIAPGPHEIEEMLRSINFGLYAKKWVADLSIRGLVNSILQCRKVMLSAMVKSLNQCAEQR